MAAGWAKGSNWVILPLATHRTKHHSPSPGACIYLPQSALQRGNSGEVGHLIKWPSVCSAQGSPEPRAFRKLGILKVVSRGKARNTLGAFLPPGRGQEATRERWAQGKMDSGKCITDDVKGLQVCLKPPTPDLLLWFLWLWNS